MKQKLIILLIIVLAIVIGVVGFFAYRVIDLDSILNRVNDNAKNTTNYYVLLGTQSVANDKAIGIAYYVLGDKKVIDNGVSKVKHYINYDGKTYTLVESNGVKTYSVKDSSNEFIATLNPIEDNIGKLSFWDKLTKIEVNDVEYLVEKESSEYVKCIEIIDKSQIPENSKFDYYKKYLFNAETFDPVSVYTNNGDIETINEYLKVEKGTVTEEMMKLPDISEYREVIN